MFPHLKYSETEVDGYISGVTPEMVVASLDDENKPVQANPVSVETKVK